MPSLKTTARMLRTKLHQRSLRVESLESRRLLAVSDLDPAFGTAGLVRDQLSIARPSNEDVMAMIEKPAGGFYLGGTVDNGRGYTGTVWSYDSQGSSVNSFGSSGRYVTPDISIQDLAISPTGKVVVGGFINNERDPFQTIPVIQQLNSNGTPDLSFGESSLVFAPGFDGASLDHLVVRPDGKIVARVTHAGGYQLLQYLPDGSIDTSFQSIPMYDAQLFKYENALLLADDGSLLTASWYLNEDNTSDVLITKHLATGELDVTFGDQGEILLPMNINALQFGLYPFRLISLGGDKFLLGSSLPSETSTYPFLFRFSGAGQPDVTFGTSGLKQIELEGVTEMRLHDVEQLPDGRLFATIKRFNSTPEGSEVFGLTLTAAGQLDTTAPQGGAIATGYSSGYIGNTAIFGNRAVFVSDFESANADSYTIQVMAFNLSTGVFDTTFSNGGRFEINADSNWSYASGYGAVQLSDGSMLTLATGPADSYFTPAPLYLFKYRSDGSRDTSFGTLGKLLIGEASDASTWSPRLLRTAAGLFVVDSTGDEIHLIKLTESGTIEPTFGEAGRSVITLPDLDRVNNLVITTDALFVAGQKTQFIDDTIKRFWQIAKVNMAGEMDSDFGNGGSVEFEVESAYSRADVQLALQPSGAILLMLNNLLGEGGNSVSIARIDALGQIDPAFGAQGLARTGFNNHEYLNRPRSLHVMSDGSFVAVGSRDDSILGKTLLRIERYAADGQLMTSFGTEGIVEPPSSGSEPLPVDMELDSLGRIVVLSSLVALPYNLVEVSRYTANGQPDVTFDGDGARTYALGKQSETMRDLLIGPHDDIFLTGEAQTDFATESMLARIIGSEPNPLAWHNPIAIEDVNGDRFVSPLDALIVINRLNSNSSSKITGNNATGSFFDVNNDGFISAIDALTIINRLNTKATGEGELETIETTLAYDQASPLAEQLDNDWAYRRRTTLLNSSTVSNSRNGH